MKGVCECPGVHVLLITDNPAIAHVPDDCGRHVEAPPGLPGGGTELGATGLSAAMTCRDIVAALRTEVVSDLRCATNVQHHRRTEPSATNAANARSPPHQRNLAVTSTANDGRKTFTQLCLTNAANASSRQQRAISSAGERSLHTREVTGSIPVSPTTNHNM